MNKTLQKGTRADKEHYNRPIRKYTYISSSVFLFLHFEKGPYSVAEN